MIRWATHIVGLAALFAAMPVIASPPSTSPRPPIRQSVMPESSPVHSQPLPVSAPTDEPIVASMAVVALPALRPPLRPVSEQEQAAENRPASLAFLGPIVSVRPYARPDSVVEQALFGRRKKRKGSVCGVLDIQGEKAGNIPGKLNGCGVTDAVRVRSVSGVMLSTPATMNCTTAQALNTWVERGVKPAFRRRGPVVEMHVAAGYACRTRNNKRGARISEHGKGKAIDISSFTMSDGEVITVAKSWGQGTAGKLLHKVWRSACGPFGTVLGPTADRYHRDHFHLDTASYRSGPYCK